MPVTVIDRPEKHILNHTHAVLTTKYRGKALSDNVVRLDTICEQTGLSFETVYFTLFHHEDFFVFARKNNLYCKIFSVEAPSDEKSGASSTEVAVDAANKKLSEPTAAQKSSADAYEDANQGKPLVAAIKADTRVVSRKPRNAKTSVQKRVGIKFESTKPTISLQEVVDAFASSSEEEQSPSYIKAAAACDAIVSHDHECENDSCDTLMVLPINGPKVVVRVTAQKSQNAIASVRPKGVKNNSTNKSSVKKSSAGKKVPPTGIYITKGQFYVNGGAVNPADISHMSTEDVLACSSEEEPEWLKNRIARCKEETQKQEAKMAKRNGGRSTKPLKRAPDPTTGRMRSTRSRTYKRKEREAEDMSEIAQPSQAAPKLSRKQKASRQRAERRILPPRFQQDKPLKPLHLGQILDQFELSMNKFAVLPVDEKEVVDTTPAAEYKYTANTRNEKRHLAIVTKRHAFHKRRAEQRAERLSLHHERQAKLAADRKERVARYSDDFEMPTLRTPTLRDVLTTVQITSAVIILLGMAVTKNVYHTPTPVRLSLTDFTHGLHPFLYLVSIACGIVGMLLFKGYKVTTGMFRFVKKYHLRIAFFACTLMTFIITAAQAVTVVIDIAPQRIVVACALLATVVYNYNNFAAFERFIARLPWYERVTRSFHLQYKILFIVDLLLMMVEYKSNGSVESPGTRVYEYFVACLILFVVNVATRNHSRILTCMLVMAYFILYTDEGFHLSNQEAWNSGLAAVLPAYFFGSGSLVPGLINYINFDLSAKVLKYSFASAICATFSHVDWYHLQCNIKPLYFEYFQRSSTDFILSSAIAIFAYTALGGQGIGYSLAVVIGCTFALWSVYEMVSHGRVKQLYAGRSELYTTLLVGFGVSLVCEQAFTVLAGLSDHHAIAVAIGSAVYLSQIGSMLVLVPTLIILWHYMLCVKVSDAIAFQINYQDVLEMLKSDKLVLPLFFKGVDGSCKFMTDVFSKSINRDIGAKTPGEQIVQALNDVFDASQVSGLSAYIDKQIKVYSNGNRKAQHYESLIRVLPEMPLDSKTRKKLYSSIVSYHEETQRAAQRVCFVFAPYNAKINQCIRRAFASNIWINDCSGYFDIDTVTNLNHASMRNHTTPHLDRCAIPLPLKRGKNPDLNKVSWNMVRAPVPYVDYGGSSNSQSCDLRPEWFRKSTVDTKSQRSLPITQKEEQRVPKTIVVPHEETTLPSTRALFHEELKAHLEKTSESFTQRCVEVLTQQQRENAEERKEMAVALGSIATILERALKSTHTTQAPVQQTPPVALTQQHSADDTATESAESHAESASEHNNTGAPSRDEASEHGSEHAESHAPSSYEDEDDSLDEVCYRQTRDELDEGSEQSESEDEEEEEDIDAQRVVDENFEMFCELLENDGLTDFCEEKYGYATTEIIRLFLAQLKSKLPPPAVKKTSTTETSFDVEVTVNRDYATLVDKLKDNSINSYVDTTYGANSGQVLIRFIELFADNNNMKLSDAGEAEEEEKSETGESEHDSEDPIKKTLVYNRSIELSEFMPIIRKNMNKILASGDIAAQRMCVWDLAKDNVAEALRCFEYLLENLGSNDEDEDEYADEETVSVCSDWTQVMDTTPTRELMGIELFHRLQDDYEVEPFSCVLQDMAVFENGKYDSDVESISHITYRYIVDTRVRKHHIYAYTDEYASSGDKPRMALAIRYVGDTCFITRTRRLRHLHRVDQAHAFSRDPKAFYISSGIITQIEAPVTSPQSHVRISSSKSSRTVCWNDEHEETTGNERSSSATFESSTASTSSQSEESFVLANDQLPPKTDTDKPTVEDDSTSVHSHATHHYEKASSIAGSATDGYVGTGNPDLQVTLDNLRDMFERRKNGDLSVDIDALYEDQDSDPLDSSFPQTKVSTFGSGISSTGSNTQTHVSGATTAPSKVSDSSRNADIDEESSTCSDDEDEDPVKAFIARCADPKNLTEEEEDKLANIKEKQRYNKINEEMKANGVTFLESHTQKGRDAPAKDRCAFIADYNDLRGGHRMPVVFVGTRHDALFKEYPTIKDQYKDLAYVAFPKARLDLFETHPFVTSATLDLLRERSDSATTYISTINNANSGVAGQYIKTLANRPAIRGVELYMPTDQSLLSEGKTNRVRMVPSTEEDRKSILPKQKFNPRNVASPYNPMWFAYDTSDPNVVTLASAIDVPADICPIADMPYINGKVIHSTKIDAFGWIRKIIWTFITTRKMPRITDVPMFMMLCVVAALICRIVYLAVMPTQQVASTWVDLRSHFDIHVSSDFMSLVGYGQWSLDCLQDAVVATYNGYAPGFVTGIICIVLLQVNSKFIRNIPLIILEIALLYYFVAPATWTMENAMDNLPTPPPFVQLCLDYAAHYGSVVAVALRDDAKLYIVKILQWCYKVSGNEIFVGAVAKFAVYRISPVYAMWKIIATILLSVYSCVATNTTTCLADIVVTDTVDWMADVKSYTDCSVTDPTGLECGFDHTLTPTNLTNSCDNMTYTHAINAQRHWDDVTEFPHEVSYDIIHANDPYLTTLLCINAVNCLAAFIVVKYIKAVVLWLLGIVYAVLTFNVESYVYAMFASFFVMMYKAIVPVLFIIAALSPAISGDLPAEICMTELDIDFDLCDILYPLATTTDVVVFLVISIASVYACIYMAKQAFYKAVSFIRACDVYVCIFMHIVATVLIYLPLYVLLAICSRCLGICVAIGYGLAGIPFKKLATGVRKHVLQFPVVGSSTAQLSWLYGEITYYTFVTRITIHDNIMFVCYDVMNILRNGLSQFVVLIRHAITGVKRTINQFVCTVPFYRTMHNLLFGSLSTVTSFDKLLNSTVSTIYQYIMLHRVSMLLPILLVWFFPYIALLWIAILATSFVGVFMYQLTSRAFIKLQFVDFVFSIYLIALDPTLVLPSIEYSNIIYMVILVVFALITRKHNVFGLFQVALWLIVMLDNSVAPVFITIFLTHTVATYVETQVETGFTIPRWIKIGFPLLTCICVYSPMLIACFAMIAVYMYYSKEGDYTCKHHVNYTVATKYLRKWKLSVRETVSSLTSLRKDRLEQIKVPMWVSYLELESLATYLGFKFKSHAKYNDAVLQHLYAKFCHRIVPGVVKEWDPKNIISIDSKRFEQTRAQALVENKSLVQHPASEFVDKLSYARYGSTRSLCCIRLNGSMYIVDHLIGDSPKEVISNMDDFYRNATVTMKDGSTHPLRSIVVQPTWNLRYVETHSTLSVQLRENVSSHSCEIMTSAVDFSGDAIVLQQVGKLSPLVVSTTHTAISHLTHRLNTLSGHCGLPAFTADNVLIGFHHHALTVSGQHFALLEPAIGRLVKPGVPPASYVPKSVYTCKGIVGVVILRTILGYTHPVTAPATGPWSKVAFGASDFDIASITKNAQLYDPKWDTNKTEVAIRTAKSIAASGHKFSGDYHTMASCNCDVASIVGVYESVRNNSVNQQAENGVESDTVLDIVVSPTPLDDFKMPYLVFCFILACLWFSDILTLSSVVTFASGELLRRVMRMLKIRTRISTFVVVLTLFTMTGSQSVIVIPLFTLFVALIKDGEISTLSAQCVFTALTIAAIVTARSGYHIFFMTIVYLIYLSSKYVQRKSIPDIRLSQAAHIPTDAKFEDLSEEQVLNTLHRFYCNLFFSIKMLFEGKVEQTNDNAECFMRISKMLDKTPTVEILEALKHEFRLILEDSMPSMTLALNSTLEKAHLMDFDAFKHEMISAIVDATDSVGLKRQSDCDVENCADNIALFLHTNRMTTDIADHVSGDIGAKIALTRDFDPYNLRFRSVEQVTTQAEFSQAVKSIKTIAARMSVTDMKTKLSLDSVTNTMFKNPITSTNFPALWNAYQEYLASYREFFETFSESGHVDLDVDTLARYSVVKRLKCKLYTTHSEDVTELRKLLQLHEKEATQIRLMRTRAAEAARRDQMRSSIRIRFGSLFAVKFFQMKQLFDSRTSVYDIVSTYNNTTHHNHLFAMDNGLRDLHDVCTQRQDPIHSSGVHEVFVDFYPSVTLEHGSGQCVPAWNELSGYFPPNSYILRVTVDDKTIDSPQAIYNAIMSMQPITSYTVCYDDTTLSNIDDEIKLQSDNFSACCRVGSTVFGCPMETHGLCCRKNQHTIRKRICDMHKSWTLKCGTTTSDPLGHSCEKCEKVEIRIPTRSLNELESFVENALNIDSVGQQLFVSTQVVDYLRYLSTAMTNVGQQFFYRGELIGLLCSHNATLGSEYNAFRPVRMSLFVPDSTELLHILPTAIHRIPYIITKIKNDAIVQQDTAFDEVEARRNVQHNIAANFRVSDTVSDLISKLLAGAVSTLQDHPTPPDERTSERIHWINCEERKQIIVRENVKISDGAFLEKISSITHGLWNYKFKGYFPTTFSARVLNALTKGIHTRFRRMAALNEHEFGVSEHLRALGCTFIVPHMLVKGLLVRRLPKLTLFDILDRTRRGDFKSVFEDILNDLNPSFRDLPEGVKDTLLVCFANAKYNQISLSESHWPTHVLRTFLGFTIHQVMLRCEQDHQKWTTHFNNVVPPDDITVAGILDFEAWKSKPKPPSTFEESFKPTITAIEKSYGCCGMEIASHAHFSEKCMAELDALCAPLPYGVEIDMREPVTKYTLDMRVKFQEHYRDLVIATATSTVRQRNPCRISFNQFIEFFGIRSWFPNLDTTLNYSAEHAFDNCSWSDPESIRQSSITELVRSHFRELYDFNPLSREYPMAATGPRQNYHITGNLPNTSVVVPDNDAVQLAADLATNSALAACTTTRNAKDIGTACINGTYDSRSKLLRSSYRNYEHAYDAELANYVESRGYNVQVPFVIADCDEDITSKCDFVVGGKADCDEMIQMYGFYASANIPLASKILLFLHQDSAFACTELASGKARVSVNPEQIVVPRPNKSPGGIWPDKVSHCLEFLDGYWHHFQQAYRRGIVQYACSIIQKFGNANAAKYRAVGSVPITVTQNGREMFASTRYNTMKEAYNGHHILGFTKFFGGWDIIMRKFFDFGQQYQKKHDVECKTISLDWSKFDKRASAHIQYMFALLVMNHAHSEIATPSESWMQFLNEHVNMCQTTTVAMGTVFTKMGGVLSGNCKTADGNTVIHLAMLRYGLQDLNATLDTGVNELTEMRNMYLDLALTPISEVEIEARLPISLTGHFGPLIAKYERNILTGCLSDDGLVVAHGKVADNFKRFTDCAYALGTFQFGADKVHIGDAEQPPVDFCSQHTGTYKGYFVPISNPSRIFSSLFNIQRLFTPSERVTRMLAILMELYPAKKTNSLTTSESSLYDCFIDYICDVTKEVELNAADVSSWFADSDPAAIHTALIDQFTRESIHATFDVMYGFDFMDANPNPTSLNESIAMFYNNLISRRQHVHCNDMYYSRPLNEVLSCYVEGKSIDHFLVKASDVKQVCLDDIPSLISELRNDANTISTNTVTQQFAGDVKPQLAHENICTYCDNTTSLITCKCGLKFCNTVTNSHFIQHQQHHKNSPFHDGLSTENFTSVCSICQMHSLKLFYVHSARRLECDNCMQFGVPATPLCTKTSCVVRTVSGSSDITTRTLAENLEAVFLNPASAIAHEFTQTIVNTRPMLFFVYTRFIEQCDLRTLQERSVKMLITPCTENTFTCKNPLRTGKNHCYDFYSENYCVFRGATLEDCGNKTYGVKFILSKGKTLHIKYVPHDALLSNVSAELFQRRAISAPAVKSFLDQNICSKPIASPSAITDGNPSQVKAANHALTKWYTNILGPAGTGKTTTAARIVAGCIAQGERVAILASSHVAVDNLANGVKSRFPSLNIARMAPKGRVIDTICTRTTQFLSDHRVYAATINQFYPDMFKPDVVIIEETSMCTNAQIIRILAAMPLTARLVTLGDPNQVPPVLSTPGIKSKFANIISAFASSRFDLCCFLNQQFRYSKEIEQFVNTNTYDGNLLPTATHSGALEFRTLSASNNKFEAKHNGTGDPYFDCVEDILALTSTRAIEDCAVLCNYNSQVSFLKKHLPEGLFVGTVDSSQGREWNCVIFCFEKSNSFTEQRFRELVVMTRAKNDFICFCADASHLVDRHQPYVNSIRLQSSVEDVPTSTTGHLLTRLIAKTYKRVRNLMPTTRLPVMSAVSVDVEALMWKNRAKCGLNPADSKQATNSIPLIWQIGLSTDRASTQISGRPSVLVNSCGQTTHDEVTRADCADPPKRQFRGFADKAFKSGNTLTSQIPYLVQWVSRNTIGTPQFIVWAGSLDVTAILMHSQIIANAECSICKSDASYGSSTHLYCADCAKSQTSLSSFVNPHFNDIQPFVYSQVGESSLEYVCKKLNIKHVSHTGSGDAVATHQLFLKYYSYSDNTASAALSNSLFLKAHNTVDKYVRNSLPNFCDVGCGVFEDTACGCDPVSPQPMRQHPYQSHSHGSEVDGLLLNHSGYHLDDEELEKLASESKTVVVRQVHPNHIDTDESYVKAEDIYYNVSGRKLYTYKKEQSRILAKLALTHNLVKPELISPQTLCGDSFSFHRVNESLFERHGECGRYANGVLKMCDKHTADYKPLINSQVYLAKHHDSVRSLMYTPKITIEETSPLQSEADIGIAPSDCDCLPQASLSQNVVNLLRHERFNAKSLSVVDVAHRLSTGKKVIAPESVVQAVPSSKGRLKLFTTKSGSLDIFATRGHSNGCAPNMQLHKGSKPIYHFTNPESVESIMSTGLFSKRDFVHFTTNKSYKNKRACVRVNPEDFASIGTMYDAGDDVVLVATNHIDKEYLSPYITQASIWSDKPEYTTCVSGTPIPKGVTFSEFVEQKTWYGAARNTQFAQEVTAPKRPLKKVRIFTKTLQTFKDIAKALAGNGTCPSEKASNPRQRGQLAYIGAANCGAKQHDCQAAELLDSVIKPTHVTFNDIVPFSSNLSYANIVIGDFEKLLGPYKVIFSDIYNGDPVEYFPRFFRWVEKSLVTGGHLCFKVTHTFGAPLNNFLQKFSYVDYEKVDNNTTEVVISCFDYNPDTKSNTNHQSGIVELINKCKLSVDKSAELLHT